MAETNPHAQVADLLQRKRDGGRRILFEHNGNGLWSDFPNGSVFVNRVGSQWFVRHRNESMHETRRFDTQLAAFNYARSMVAGNAPAPRAPSFPSALEAMEREASGDLAAVKPADLVAPHSATKSLDLVSMTAPRHFIPTMEPVPLKRGLPEMLRKAAVLMLIVVGALVLVAVHQAQGH